MRAAPNSIQDVRATAQTSTHSTPAFSNTWLSSETVLPVVTIIVENRYPCHTC